VLSVATDFWVAETVFVGGAMREERLKKRPKRGPVGGRAL